MTVWFYMFYNCTAIANAKLATLPATAAAKVSNIGSVSIFLGKHVLLGCAIQLTAAEIAAIAALLNSASAGLDGQVDDSVAQVYVRNKPSKDLEQFTVSTT